MRERRVLGALRLLPAHPRRQPAAEQLEFEAVRELEPGPQWRARFESMWPGYRAWYEQKGSGKRPTLGACRRALERHMPELAPVHERLVELAGGDELAARLLSLYRPPGFVVGCSQGAWTRAAAPVSRRASARSTPRRTSRPRAGSSTAGRASCGSSRSTASRESSHTQAFEQERRAA